MIPQLRRLDTLERFRSHVAGLGVEIPLADQAHSEQFSSPVTVRDAAAGELLVPNRFAVLPMEGWDAERDGRPSDLVRRRWSRFAASGCGLVWGEATAVRHDGRANPNQLVLDGATAEGIAELRASLDRDQVAGLQLTHSGRYARPDGDPAPRTAYEHPLLDDHVGASAASVMTDDEIDELVADYVRAAVLARAGGFDFVDVKHCHGYFAHELLSGFDRPGRYGGDLSGRTAFLRAVVAGIRSAAPDLAVAVRLSLFDFVPFVAGEGGIGVPAQSGRYRYAFGGDGTGLGLDLDETHAFLDEVEALGIGLVSTTAGSPYSCPHVQRPAYFPPSDGYQPPEDPLVGVARQLAATADIAHRHPGLVVVGSGYSYLQEWLPNVAQAVLESGGAGMVGLGRMILSYPELAADVLGGRPLRSRQICRTFSDCTTAPRAGLVSGCYPLDPFYKARPERAALTRAKRDTRARLR